MRGPGNDDYPAEAGKLFDRYNKKIYNLAFRMTGDHDLSREITQETFVIIFNKIDQFRGESDIYTWIYRIAKNQCFLHLRNIRKTSRAELEELISRVAEVPDKKGFSEYEVSDLVSQVKEGCLTGLLRSLSLYQRSAFILHVFAGFSIKETSEIMEKSPGGIKTLIYRARHNLRDFLCRNCSLYDPGNKCRCENMINFSLKQGWISVNNNQMKRENNLPGPDEAEDELDKFIKVSRLYRSLPDAEIPEKIREVIRSGSMKIFN